MKDDRADDVLQGKQRGRAPTDVYVNASPRRHGPGKRRAEPPPPETEVVVLVVRSLRRPGAHSGAQDPAAAVVGGPSWLRDVERGLLPRRSLVRLVHGPRHRVGGRLAPRRAVRDDLLLPRAEAFRKCRSSLNRKSRRTLFLSVNLGLQMTIKLLVTGGKSVAIFNKRQKLKGHCFSRLKNMTCHIKIMPLNVT